MRAIWVGGASPYPRAGLLPVSASASKRPAFFYFVRPESSLCLGMSPFSWGNTFEVTACQPRSGGVLVLGGKTFEVADREPRSGGVLVLGGKTFEVADREPRSGGVPERSRGLKPVATTSR